MAAAIGSGWRKCFAEAARRSGRTPSQAKIESAFLQAQGAINRNLKGGMSLLDAVQKAGADYAAEQKLALALEKRDRARNIMLAQSLDGLAIPGKVAEAPRTLLTGRSGSADFGAARSVDAQRHGLVSQLVGPMLADMRKAGVLKAVNARVKAFDRDVAREMWRLTDPASGTPTGNRAAEQVARIIHKAQETARNLQNEAGAWINKMDHYIVRQSHDMEKVRAAGFEAWRDAILPKLSDRTFAHLDDVSDIPEFLKEAFLNIQSGVHDAANPAALKGYAGPGNLAKKASAERVLHFKSADDWFDYNLQFGNGAVIDTATTGLMRAARNVALMRTFGTNPEAMYQGWIERLIGKARDAGDTATIDALRGQQRANDNIMKVITGEADIPENMTLAKVGAWVRVIQTLAKLGNVVISSFTDLSANAGTLRHNGIPLFEGFSRQIVGLLPKGAETRLVADELAAGVDGLLANMAHRFHAEDGALGRMAKMVDMFHRINGLAAWTDSLKSSAGLMITNNLAKNAGREFGALDARLQVTLRRYGIGEDDWNALRQMEMRAADGRVYMMPAGVEDNPALKTKLQTLITDQVREGMSEPTAGTRAAVTQGLARGTIAGEAIRMLMQFKQFPLTFYERTIKREIGDQGSIGGVANLIVASSLLGYLSYTLKDIANGRAPRDPQDLAGYSKAVMRAMAQGGGLGLYGDFLFGEASHLGAGPVVSALGPAVGTADDIGKFFQAVRDGAFKGDMGHTAASAASLAKNNTPFVNLFYSRLALDHLIWFKLQEAANPGFLSRYQRTVEKQNSQTFWLSPAGQVSPGARGVLGDTVSNMLEGR